MTSNHPACRRTMAWMRARLAMRLSVRVGNVLRRQVGADGDAGHLSISSVYELFQADDERTEAKRLIGIAQRWPRRKGAEIEENGYSGVENRSGLFLQEDGE